MPIDFIYLVLLVWFMMKGYRKGLVFAALSLAAVIIAMLAALKFSHKLSAWLFDEHSSLSPWIPMLSYLIVFIAIVFIINIIARTIDKGLRTVKLGWVNKMAGALVYGIIVTFVWSSVLWLADKVSLIKPETKAGSKTYTIVEPFAAKGFEIIGKVLPFVKDSYTELGDMFDKVNNNLP